MAARIAFLLLALLVAGPAVAQPDAAQLRPGLIRLIVPFPPGGFADTLAQLIAGPLEAALRQPVRVENRPGASGLLGSEMVARAAPDGHVLGISNSAPHGIALLARSRPPFDALADFSHIALLAETPSVLLVADGNRLRNLGQFVLAARTWPEGLTIGTPGAASLQSLQGLLLAEGIAAPPGSAAAADPNRQRRMAGSRLVLVPYPGTTPALRDLLAGDVVALLGPLSGTIEAVRRGTARALAVSSAEPTPLLPGTPTFAQAGLPQLSAMTWAGLSGPRGMLPALVARLNRIVLAALAEAEMVRKLEAAGVVAPRPLDPAGFTAHVAGYLAAWGPRVREAGLRAE